MSALIAMHVPDTKSTTLSIPISELRKNDIILDGVGIHQPVTVNSIFDPREEVDVRMLTLIDSHNNVFYRKYSVKIKVTIQN